MARNKIIIIHFQPLEFYPPIQNLLSVMKNSEMNKDILVISTTQTKLDSYNLNSESITISRINTYSSNRLNRLLRHFHFYILSLYKLIRYRPGTVLYFESISAFPAIVYKLFFKKKRLLVHYHEYTTKEEYNNGMLLVKWNHFLECRYYSKFSWISHTNPDRLKLFLKDIKIDYPLKIEVMPNYPTENWINMSISFFSEMEANKSKPVRLVYIGALSFEDTYIKEICKYVLKNKDKYRLDIYAFTVSIDVRNYLNELNTHVISFNGSVNYKDIPKLLSQYQIGLILYKGNVPNFIFNAPNKLFEYLNNGLDLWFPEEMKGCAEFISMESPKVIPVNFNAIDTSLIDYKYTVKKLPQKKYSTENAVNNLIKHLEND